MSDTPPAVAAAKRRLVDHPVAKVLVVVLPALISGVVTSYRANLDAKAKALATHVQAEAGYMATVAAVRALEKAVTDKSDRIARLEGQVQILANHLDKHTTEYQPVRPPRRLPEPADSANEALGRVRKAPAAVPVPMRLPTDLEQAVEWGKGKK